MELFSPSAPLASGSITGTRNGRREKHKQRWSLNGALCQSPMTQAAVPRWDTLRPPKDYVLTDVSLAILYPINVDENVKTGAWTWYRNSTCAWVGGGLGFDVILHGSDIFKFDSFDDRWMSDLVLPLEVKKALWNARVAECRLSSDKKGVKACLDRATGVIEVDAEWAQYLTSCGPHREMVYLSSRSGNVGQEIKK